MSMMMMMEFDYDELVRAADGFSPSRLLGKGSHGSVYKGHLEHGDHTVVAIKTPSTSLSPAAAATTPPSSMSVSSHLNLLKAEKLKKLQNEIRILSSLPSTPNVVSFLGASRDSVVGEPVNVTNNKLMVMEFMPNGSLHHLLHVSTTPPTWLQRVEIALQVARAVQFLHELAIVHRDIKSENVLFDSNWNAKLADFGLSVSQGVDSDGQTSPPAGTIGYIDPCYTSAANLSTKTDVFSYGVLLLEIVSGRKALDLSRSPASVVDWAIPLINDGKIGDIFGEGSVVSPPTPSWMTGTLERLLRMALRCVSPEQEVRPSASEIVAEISVCLTEPPRNLPTWISVLREVVMMRRRRKRGKWRGETLTEREVSWWWLSQTYRVK